MKITQTQLVSISLVLGALIIAIGLLVYFRIDNKPSNEGAALAASEADQVLKLCAIGMTSEAESTVKASLEKILRWSHCWHQSK